MEDIPNKRCLEEKTVAALRLYCLRLNEADEAGWLRDRTFKPVENVLRHIVTTANACDGPERREKIGPITQEYQEAIDRFLLAERLYCESCAAVDAARATYAALQEQLGYLPTVVDT